MFRIVEQLILFSVYVIIKLNIPYAFLFMSHVSDGVSSEFKIKGQSKGMEKRGTLIYKLKIQQNY